MFLWQETDGLNSLWSQQRSRVFGERRLRTRLDAEPLQVQQLLQTPEFFLIAVRMSGDVPNVRRFVRQAIFGHLHDDEAEAVNVISSFECFRADGRVAEVTDETGFAAVPVVLEEDIPLTQVHVNDSLLMQVLESGADLQGVVLDTRLRDPLFRVSESLFVQVACIRVLHQEPELVLRRILIFAPPFAATRNPSDRSFRSIGTHGEVSQTTAGRR